MLNRISVPDRQSRALRQFWIAIGLIMVGGAILRTAHVASFYYSPVVDMLTYLDYGEIYAGPHKLADLPAERLYLTTRNPPGYPAFTGVVRLLFGWENIRAILWIQVLFDVLTIGIIAWTARFLFGARAGLLSALIYAIYRIAILYTGQIMTETVAMLLCTAAVCAFLWSLERPHWSRTALAGVLLAAAVYVRINVIFLAGAFALYAALSGMREWRAGHATRLVVVKYPAVLLAAMVVCMAPWSLRNSLVLKQFVVFNGSNAERFLQGSNPVGKGEYTPKENLPESWQKRLNVPFDQRDQVTRDLSREFLLKTHPAYFWFTVVPTKLTGLLWNDYWMFTGQGLGAGSELPLGIRFRFPLVESGFIVTIGLVGLFLAGRRYRWFPAIVWALLFFPLAYLQSDARYRFLSEMPLVISSAAVLDRAFFRKAFKRRFTFLLLGLGGVCLVWSGVAWIRFSGPNVLANPDALKSNPVLEKMVTSEFVFSRPMGKNLKQQVIPIGTVPVDGGHCSHLALKFNFRLLKPKEREHEYGALDSAWPTVKIICRYLDEKGRVIGLAGYPHTELGDYLSSGGYGRELLELAGQTIKMQMELVVNESGTVIISGLEARGPVWLRKDGTSWL